MEHGGRRAGAGRPEGARSRRSIEIEEQARQAAAVIEAVIGEPFTGDAHALLMTVYKDPRLSLDLRIEAAKAAIRYERPALAAIDVAVDSHVVHEISSEPLTPEERDAEWEAKHCGPPKTEH